LSLTQGWTRPAGEARTPLSATAHLGAPAVSRPRIGSGSAWVGPGQGQGLSAPQKPRKCWLGPGGSGWSGYLIFSFVSAHKIITRDMHVTWGRHYGGVRGVGQKPGPTRTTRTHGGCLRVFHSASQDPSRPQCQINPDPPFVGSEPSPFAKQANCHVRSAHRGHAPISNCVLPFKG
jgi:hypothetical protein